MEFKGYTYGYLAKKGVFRSAEGEKSQDLLFETGINWMCLAFAAVQDTVFSTEIRYDYRTQPTDADIIHAVKRAHDRGVKVCIKPMVNCGDGMWRAYIAFPDETMWGEDIYWKRWFESYSAYMLHYAEIAEETGCEMLCIGCEMTGTERKEDYWRRLIADIRKVYGGKLTYNTNHGKELTVSWFDAVDYVGTSAYYPVAKKGGASYEDMCRAWEYIAGGLEKVYEKWHKPLIFMEIGCRSAEGCAAMPWDFTHNEYPYSEDEQANFFASAIDVMSKRDWFGGMFWWDWSSRIYDDRETASKDMGFNIHLKKAEEIIKERYGRL